LFSPSEALAGVIDVFRWRVELVDGGDIFGRGVLVVVAVTVGGCRELVFDDTFGEGQEFEHSGDGFAIARRRGTQAHDEIYPGLERRTNHAGGIEAGVSNGEPIVVRAYKKPISTLAARGPSVKMATRTESPASYERSDVCAVPAASVIMQNVVAFEIAAAIVEKYGAGSLGALLEAVGTAHERTRRHLTEWPPAKNQAANSAPGDAPQQPSSRSASVISQARKSPETL